MTTALELPAFPPIPLGDWRESAACAQHPEPWLWDALRDGEKWHEQAYRHRTAKAICQGCPVLLQCLKAVDREVDEGIRAGHLFTIRPGQTAPRSTADQLAQEKRERRAAQKAAIASKRVTCVCGLEMRASSLKKHVREHCPRGGVA